MNTNYIKYGIIGLLIAGAVSLFFIGEVWWGILAIFLAGLVTITLFWHEKHLLTLFLMKRNKFNSSEKILNSMKNIERLPKHQQAYHYFMIGNVMSYNRSAKAASQYQKALNIGLKSKTNQAIAKLNIAANCLMRRRKQEAVMHLREVKKLDKYGLLSEQVKMVELQLKRI